MGNYYRTDWYTQSRNLTPSDGEIFYRAIASHSINTRRAANSKNSQPHLWVVSGNTTFAADECGNVGL